MRRKEIRIQTLAPRRGRRPGSSASPCSRSSPAAASSCRGPRCCRACCSSPWAAWCSGWPGRCVATSRAAATTSLDPLRAARTVVLAQAAALTGSAAAGWYLGQAGRRRHRPLARRQQGPAAAARRPRRRRGGARRCRAGGPALVPGGPARRGRRREGRPRRLAPGSADRSRGPPRGPVPHAKSRPARAVVAAPGTNSACRTPSELLRAPDARPYLSMSPTTKNIEPRIATRSATRQPGSSCEQHLDVVERRRAQLQPPRRLLAAGDQVVAVDAERVLGPGVGCALGRLEHLRQPDVDRPGGQRAEPVEAGVGEVERRRTPARAAPRTGRGSRRRSG